MTESDPDFSSLAARSTSLLVLDGVARVSPLRELLDLYRVLGAVTTGAGTSAAAEATLGAAYSAAFRALVCVAAPSDADPLAWGVAGAVSFDENALSRAATATVGPEPDANPSAPPLLIAAVAEDLRTLQALVSAAGSVATVAATSLGRRLPWPAAGDGAAKASCQSGFAAQLLQSDDWGDLAPALAAHYTLHGSGTFARHRAFRWTGDGFEPVLGPDVVPPESLIGYEAERALLRRNTAQFVAGYTGNNVLLYGDRGTGKSSSVKSLLSERARDGERGWERLRLVEVPKARLADFPHIAARLRGRPERFILFVDDLSFEEGETQYKDMKAMLEGGLEPRPGNVAVYATSNRRHLIREHFRDRTNPDSDEVHARDTVEEKLSFADRFGMTITFPSPDQRAYLAIVEGLARQRGLHMDPAGLRSRAIEWAAWHNGRSGRTARQFVDYLEGELAVERAAS